MSEKFSQFLAMQGPSGTATGTRTSNGAEIMPFAFGGQNYRALATDFLNYGWVTATGVTDNSVSQLGASVGDSLDAIASNIYDFLPTSGQVTITVTTATSSPAVGSLQFGLDTGFFASAQGSTFGDNAVAGNVGEYIDGTASAGGGVAMASGTATNCLHLTLNPGDWDVSGQVAFTGSATNIGFFGGGINTSSAILPTAPYQAVGLGFGTSIAYDPKIALVPRRFTSTATITAYLNCEGVFTGGSLIAYGYLRARRMR